MEGINNCVHAQYSTGENVNITIFYKSAKLQLARNRAEAAKLCLGRLRIKLKIAASDEILVADSDRNMVSIEEPIETVFTEKNSVSIGQNILPIYVNMPSISSLSYGPFPIVGIPIIPKCTFENSNEEMSLWNWSRCLPNSEEVFVNVSSENVYIPTEADIGSSLRVCCVPRAHVICADGSQSIRTGEAVVFHFQPTITSSSKVAKKSKQTSQSSSVTSVKAPAMLPHVVSAYTLHNALLDRLPLSVPHAKESFRVCTYNILLDAFCDNEWALNNIYPYLLPDSKRLYANIDVRKQAILAELLNYKADIICLQEMSLGLFDDYFKPQFERLGYVGYYANKKSTQPFGCATFINTQSFQVIDIYCADLTSCWKSSEIANNQLIAESLYRFPDVQEHFERTTTTAQYVLAKDLSNDRFVCIINGHLFSSPQAPHFRVLQSALIMYHLEVIRKCANLNEIPVIFCVDLNANCDSGAFEFLTKGCISAQHFEWGEGLVFTDLQTDSQVERQMNWHNVMTEEDVTLARKAFYAFSKYSASLLLNGASSITWEDIERALEQPTATIVTDILVEFQLDKFSEMSYANFFAFLAKFKQRNRQLYDRWFEVMMMFGEVSVPALTFFQASAKDSLPFIALDLHHEYCLVAACMDAQITHFAGQIPSSSRLDNIFFDGSQLELSANQPKCIPTEAIVSTGGLPCENFPSDHVSLLADLRWSN